MKRAPRFALLLLLVSPTALGAGDPPRYSVRDLGTLAGDRTDAADLNDAGWVVGSSRVTVFDFHAFLWLGGGLQIPTLGVVGTAFLALLLAGAGAAILGRRRRSVARRA